MTVSRSVQILVTAAGLLVASSADVNRSLPAISPAHIEVAQSIQDESVSALIVAEKATLIRVFFDPPTQGLRITAKLRLKNGGQPLVLDPVVPLDISPTSSPWQVARLYMDRSLNFVVPEQKLTPGSWTAELTNLATTDGQPLAASLVLERDFLVEIAVPMQICLIGLRYPGLTSNVEPRTVDFELIKRWICAAYPVSKGSLSVDERTVDYDGPPDADSINQFLEEIRNLDVSNGLNRGMHYYGMYPDNNGNQRIGGRASYIPSTPSANAVACGPVGRPGPDEPWDTDESYGDWYAGHELAHTFGRMHISCVCRLQAPPPYQPYTNSFGHLSANGESFIGYEFSEILNPPFHPSRLMRGSQWHDIMGYCDERWTSDLTQRAVYARLADEKRLLGSSGPPPRGDFLLVQAKVNISAKEVLSIDVARTGIDLGMRIASDQVGLKARVLALDLQGEVLVYRDVDVTEGTREVASGERNGTLSATLPAKPGIAKIKVILLTASDPLPTRLLEIPVIRAQERLDALKGAPLEYTIATAGNRVDTQLLKKMAEYKRVAAAVNDYHRSFVVGNIRVVKHPDLHDDFLLRWEGSISDSARSSYTVELDVGNGFRVFGYRLKNQHLRIKAADRLLFEGNIVRVRATDGFTTGDAQSVRLVFPR